jgi:hypothetical protein
MKLSLISILESDDSTSRGFVHTQRVTVITITGFTDKITPERVQKYLKPQGVETELVDGELLIKSVTKLKKAVTNPDEKVTKIKLILSNAGWDTLKVNTELKASADVIKPKFESYINPPVKDTKIGSYTDEEFLQHFKKQIEDFALKNRSKLKSLEVKVNGKPIQLSLDLKECGCEYGNSMEKKPRYKPDYQDPEGEMAKQQLYKVAKYAAELYKLLDDNDELDAWVQDKLSKASDYMSSVKHYLEYEKMTNSSNY